MWSQVLAAIAAIIQLPDKIAQLAGYFEKIVNALEQRNKLEFLRQSHELTKTLNKAETAEEYDDFLKKLSDLHHKL